eukprot:SAG11_NODE_7141_length_1187_cov_2.400735_1_plen_96_part_10
MDDPPQPQQQSWLGWLSGMVWGSEQPRPAKRARRGSSEITYASECIIPESWVELPLLEISTYNHDTSLFTFGLEPLGRGAEATLDLPVCGCLQMQA